MRLFKILSSLFFLSFLSVGFYSCGLDADIPVTPPAPQTILDSSRYRWHEFTTAKRLSVSKVWFRDQNDIIVGSDEFLYARFQNNNFSYFYFTDFYPSALGGFDKNTGYILGKGMFGDSLIHIKKWNGNNFSDLSVNSIYTPTDIGCFFYKPNEMWVFSLFSQKVYKFDGSTFTQYNIPFSEGSDNSVEKIYFDSVSNKVSALVRTSASTNENRPVDYSKYDLNDQSWVKVGDFTLTNPDYLQSINGYLLSRNSNQVNIFNGNSFNAFLNSTDFEFNSRVNGFSRENILAGVYDGRRAFGDEKYYYNWNGRSWSKEIKQRGVINPITDNCYLIADEYYFAVGIRK